MLLGNAESNRRSIARKTSELAKLPRRKSFSIHIPDSLVIDQSGLKHYLTKGYIHEETKGSSGLIYKQSIEEVRKEVDGLDFVVDYSMEPLFFAMVALKLDELKEPELQALYLESQIFPDNTEMEGAMRTLRELKANLRKSPKKK